MRQREPITIAGPDLGISGPAISSVALLLHEFGTNSAKYGALSAPNGQVEIVGAEHGQTLCPHMDGTWRTRHPRPAGRRRVWRHSHSRDSLGPTRRENLPRLEARGTRHPAIPAARAFGGMNWAKHPPARSRASLLGHAHLSFADRAASAWRGRPAARAPPRRPLAKFRLRRHSRSRRRDPAGFRFRSVAWPIISSAR